MTLSIRALYHTAKCLMCLFFKLNVIMMSTIMLNVVILSVIMLIVVVQLKNPKAV